MKNLSLLSACFLVIPLTTNAQSFQTMLVGTLTFLNDTVIPFLLGIGFLFVVINGVRYFVFEGATEDGREKSKALAIYGVTAFVIIVIFWGIVNLLTASIGLDKETQPAQDYVKMKSK